MKKMPLVPYQMLSLMILLAGSSYLFLSLTTFYFSMRFSDLMEPISAIILLRLGFPELASKISLPMEIIAEAIIGLIFIGLWFWLINRKR